MLIFLDRKSILLTEETRLCYLFKRETLYLVVVKQLRQNESKDLYENL